jgi:tight adherence protein C
MSVLIVYLLVFCTTVIIALAFCESLLGQRHIVSARLFEIQKMEVAEEAEDELKRPFFERLVKPLFSGLVKTMVSLTPAEMRRNIEKKIAYAGNPWNMTFNSFVTLQVLLLSLFVSLAFLIAWLARLEGARAFLLIALSAVTGAVFPLNMINSRVVQRQKQIQQLLPDTLDLLLVSVEAGLGFDMSLKKVAEQSTGPLSREIMRALEEMRFGKTREEALRGIVKRTGVADLSSFISAVIQSEQLGSNIANTLRAQASVMRQKRRQRAEESAMKAPIKMLFHLVFFIFPALFVVLLGPALIRIMQTFGGMF